MKRGGIAETNLWVSGMAELLGNSPAWKNGQAFTYKIFSLILMFKLNCLNSHQGGFDGAGGIIVILESLEEHCLAFGLGDPLLEQAALCCGMALAVHRGALVARGKQPPSQFPCNPNLGIDHFTQFGLEIQEGVGVQALLLSIILCYTLSGHIYLLLGEPGGKGQQAGPRDRVPVERGGLFRVSRQLLQISLNFIKRLKINQIQKFIGNVYKKRFF